MEADHTTTRAVTEGREAVETTMTRVVVVVGVDTETTSLMVSCLEILI